LFRSWKSQGGTLLWYGAHKRQAAEQLERAERQVTQLRGALAGAESRLQGAAAENAALAAAAAAAAAAPQAAGPFQAARRPFRPPSAPCALSSVAAEL